MGIEFSCNQNRAQRRVLALAEKHKGITMRFKKEVFRAAENLINDPTPEEVERAKAIAMLYPILLERNEKALSTARAAESACKRTRDHMWEDAESDLEAHFHHDDKCDCAEDNMMFDFDAEVFYE